MLNSPEKIYTEYKQGVAFKSSIGRRGLFEQNKINERFYVGDQWHGAAVGGERPLVRHNVVRRIGDYKIAQLSAEPIDISFSAEGVSQNQAVRRAVADERKRMAEKGGSIFAPITSSNETALTVSALNSYHKTTAHRVGLDGILAQALRDAYITGTGIVYTYYDPDIKTGLFADETGGTPIFGDIVCQRLRVEEVCFGDPSVTEVQEQPYIIISARRRASELAAEAERFGAPLTHIERLKAKGEEKITVFTKLYKAVEGDKRVVYAVRATEDAIVRPDFSTRISSYPISVFSWEQREGCIYGDSEITYIIPNQIAINRMITAGVWSAMSSGMPLMVVNGDLVGGEISNEPGQVIKVYGNAEEISSAVSYVNPPDHSAGYNEAVNNLITNTLTQCGANEAFLGDLDADNYSAIVELRQAAATYLEPIKKRYYRFVEDISLIWADMFFALYGKRCLKITDEHGVWYFPFDAERYSSLVLSVTVSATESITRSQREGIAALGKLLEQGAITPAQYVKRLPEWMLPDSKGLLEELEKEAKYERI